MLTKKLVLTAAGALLAASAYPGCNGGAGGGSSSGADSCSASAIFAPAGSACESCVQAQCSAQLSSYAGSCSDYVGCFCSAGGNPQQLQGCSAKAQEPSCLPVAESMGQCETAKCAAACSGGASSSASSSGGIPQCQGGSSSGGSSAACDSCIESSCSSQLSTVLSACSAYISCYEGCQCTDVTCLSGCQAQIQSNTACQQAVGPLESCEQSSCLSPCTTTSGSSSGPSGSSSGPTGINGSDPSSVPNGTAYVGPDVACIAGDAWQVPAGDPPPDADPSAGLACSVDPVTDPATGDDVYCCFDWTNVASTCTDDPSLTADCQAACAADTSSPCQPGNVFGFTCAAGDDPTSLDSSLDCSADPEATGAFCCE